MFRIRPFATTVVALLAIGFVLLGTASVAGAQTVTLSEIRIDQPSTDNDEFFELAGTPGTSLDGLTYLVIGDGAGGSGVIEAVVDLTGEVVDTNGFFVAAEATFTQGTADLIANLNFENSDNVTHLVVRDFTGANGDDLDTDDDGTLDVMPFAALEDCLALIESTTSGELTYCTTGIGPDGTFVPGHVSACPGGFAVSSFDVGVDDTPGAANQCPAPPMPVLVINEIDYDQPGTDAAEFIEITNTGTGAADLSAYQLELVNGSGGGAVVYNTIILPAVSLAPGDYFVVCGDATTVDNCDLDASPDSNLIQNGAPDAVALTSGGMIVDTVSYEGDVPGFTEGSGSGLADNGSTGNDDLGISRFADGADTDMNNVDFVFACITPGAANTDVAVDCGITAEPTLVINEIDYDQPGSDAAEFIELKNVGPATVNLGGFTVELINGNGGASYNTITLPAVSLAADDYFVICGDPSTVFNCDLDASPDSNLVQNGAPDAVALFQGATLIDTVSYEGDVPGFVEGSGAGLTDSGSSGEDNKGISRTPDGLDTDSNNVDFQFVCVTPGAANSTATTDCVAPGPPSLVVNEIDYDQPGADTAEFVEIKNVGAGIASLDGVTLQLVNGSNAATYQTIALPAATVAAGGYFVVCADALTVANCDLEAVSSIQNGAPDAVALFFDGAVIDTVSYEGDVTGFVEGSGAGLEDSGATGEDFKGIGRSPDGVDTDQNNVDWSSACITPGAANAATATGCTANGPAFEIFEIQGAGLASPFDGQTVTTLDNVVTAVAPDGFFIQTPIERTDGDAETSDGLFVFTDTAPAAVAEGDRVDVVGTVDEFFDLTEITNVTSVTVLSSGNPLPASISFDATTPSPNQPQPANEVERYEGMLVIFDGFASGATDRFGDTAVTTQATRAFREPGIEFPGLPGLPVWDGNPELFEIDSDGLGGVDEVLFAGQLVAAEGPLTFSFGDYQVLPKTLAIGPMPTLPRPVRDRAPGELSIATQNMLRFFDDVDDPGIGEPVLDTADFQGLLGKFSLHVRNVLGSPDVLAVQEVENLNVLVQLAARIAADDPSVVYSAHLFEGNDVGGIDVGYLTRDDTIQVNAVDAFGASILLSVDGSLLFDRPPLVLDATYIGAGGPFDFTTINLHQRSLSGIDNTGSSGDRVRTKRLEQAQEVAGLVQDLQTTDPDIRLVVTGDFNGFQFTDGYVDMLGIIAGDLDPAGAQLPGTDVVDPNLTNQILTLPAEERYSFIFGGSAQSLDHMLTSSAMTPFVSDIAYARGNADVPSSFMDDDTTPLRVSDHDGLVLFLALVLDEDGDGVLDEVDLCPGTMIPEDVPTVRLGFFRFALVDGDTTFDTRWPFHNPPTFTTADTGGCGCEQIIDQLHLGNGQRKFGCGFFVMKFWTFAVQQYFNSEAAGDVPFVAPPFPSGRDVTRSEWGQQ